MNRLSKLVRSARSAKGIVEETFLRNAPLSLFTQDEMDEMNAYTKYDLVYACISTTARAISQVPLRLMSPVPGQKGVWEAVGDHPVQLLVNNPNRLTDRYKFVESVVSFLLLDGNTFIIHFPPGKGLPDSLHVVRKNFIKPVRGEKTNNLEGWVYNPSHGGQEAGNSIPLEIEDVTHVAFWNPNDSVMGASPIKAGNIPITTDYEAAKYNKVFFDQGAVPGGVLHTDQRLSRQAFERIKQQFEARHEGGANAHKVAVLEQGLKYAQMGLSHKDMEFMDLREFNESRILQVFGMKKTILSVNKNLNRATAKEEKKDWWTGTNIPLMKLVASALTRGLLPGSNMELRFDTSNVEALHEHFSDKVKTAETLHKIGFSANEINERLHLGFEEAEWRKYWYVPANTVRVDSDGTIASPVVHPGPTPNPESPDSEAPLEDSPDGDKRFLFAKEVDPQAEWEAVRYLLFPLEEKLEGNIRRVFYGFRKKVLVALESGLAAFDNEVFLDDIQDLLKVVNRANSQAVLLGTRGAEAISDDSLVSFSVGRSNHIRGIIPGLRRAVRREFLKDGSIEDVKRILTHASSRSGIIARTEVFGSYNFANNQNIRAGKKERKMWVSASDEKDTRPSHASMNGTVIGKNESWKLPTGAVVRFPGDFAAPPGEVVGCRCIEISAK